MNYNTKKWYKMKHNGHPMDVLTDTKSLTDVLTPPNPNIWGVSPIAHADTPWNIYIQGSIQICGGVGHMGRCPSI